PNGDYVTSTDGVLLDGSVLGTREYAFTVTMYGDYSVSYVAEDQNFNQCTAGSVIIVEDETAPVITLNCDAVVTVPQLVVYKIDAYSITDDLCAKEDLIVTVFVMDQFNSVVSVGEEFETKYAGTYTVYVYCEDTAGNGSFASYTVVVEAANQ
ncbi:MAG: hypothetical protein J6A46_01660, partial [Clostridia bacterium]|nr:hypothetical protein [Clostridia bacterium]